MPEANDYFSDTQQELRERGLALGQAEGGIDGLPAGHGQWVVPHFQTYTALTNYFSRSYRWLYDEALKHSETNANAMENDAVISEALFTRRYPTSQISWHVQPRDETDPQQVKAAAKITEIIRHFVDFDDLRFSLLEGIWYGRQGAQMLYRWEFVNGETLMIPLDYQPINGQKLVFKWSRDVGVLVNAMYPGTKTPTERGYAVFMTPEQREQVIVYHHERRDTGYYQNDTAGQIEGVGLRSRVYWIYFLKVNILAQLLTFIQRYCSGIAKGTFPLSNPNGKSELASSIAGVSAGNAFVSPTNPADGRALYTFAVDELGTANPSFIYTFLRDYFDYQIRRLILGDIEAIGESGGVGGDEASLRADSLAGIRRWDARKLDVCLTKDFLTPLYRWNCPGVPVGLFKSDIDSPNTAEILSHAEVIHGLGGDIDLNFLYDVAGFPRPQPGSNVASPVQPLSPVAVGATPEGVPVAGQGGPQQQVVPSEVVAQQQQAQQQSPTSQPVSILDA